ncbi:MAG: dimethylarginine dimethylaminohydrolase family protein [Rhizomicrobium sp.]
MRFFYFDRAIVRKPAESVVDGLRADKTAVPDFEAIRQEHSAYIAALAAASVTVEVLPPLEQYPDSMFVEDPALVFREGAILLRPGAPSRLRECDHMREVLKSHFEQLLELGCGDERVDGGDVLVTPDAVVIGLTRRTNRAGADALAAQLDRLGRNARIVEVPEGLLHLKTGVSLVDEETVLASPRVAETGIFSGFRVVAVLAEEEAASNALRINDTIFVGACYPRTRDLLVKQGFNVQALPVTEIAKLDAGLSCMSLRWLALAA